MKKIFRVIVDYSKSLTEMIRAGNYDAVERNIDADHFPIKDQGKIGLDIELIHYGKYMFGDDIIRDLNSRGLRPATLPELLAFGSAYPNKQREFPIMALGSLWRRWHGFRCVPFLHGLDSNSRRWLSFRFWFGGWYDICRFAAIRK